MAATNSFPSVHIDSLHAWIANSESLSNIPGPTIPHDPTKDTVHRSNSPLVVQQEETEGL
eukprot:8244684-Ditylum_brightwellii.AAC.1